MTIHSSRSSCGTWINTSLFASLACLFLQSANWAWADDAADSQEEYSTRLFITEPDGSQMKQASQLTEFQKQGSPSWSLDGKLIAFDGWKPQLGETFSKSRVIVMNADGTNPRIFEDAAMPSFSPDGGRIVVSRPTSGGVWVINLASEATEAFVQIDPRGWGADWSPNGKIVYATHGREGANLVVIDLVEGRRKLFSETETPYGQIFWNMAWSRDSKLIAFKAANRDGKLEIGVVDVRGEKFGLKRQAEETLLASFAWSPDGTHVLFTKKSPERDRLQIYAVKPDLTEAPQLLAGLDPERNYSDIAYSPDGKHLLLSCHKRTPVIETAKEEFTTRLFVANSDASNMRPVTNLPEYQAQGSPDWSLDGKLIAFDAWMPQKGEEFPNSRVIVVNADGTEPRIFEDASMPSFSPGGRRMVVSRPVAGGIWIIDLDKQAPDNFTRVDSSGWGADWSHDGKIVYATHKGGANLKVVDVVEGSHNVFNELKTRHSRIYWNMAWSRDSQRIAYKAVNRDGKTELSIVDARGDTFSFTSRNSENLLASFAWNPDGTQVLFVENCPERGHFQIYSLNPNTKDEPKLLPGQDPERSYADIAYSPDGKQILISCWKRTPTAKPATPPAASKQNGCVALLCDCTQALSSALLTKVGQRLSLADAPAHQARITRPDTPAEYVCVVESESLQARPDVAIYSFTRQSAACHASAAVHTAAPSKTASFNRN